MEKYQSSSSQRNQGKIGTKPRTPAIFTLHQRYAQQFKNQKMRRMLPKCIVRVNMKLSGSFYYFFFEKNQQIINKNLASLQILKQISKFLSSLKWVLSLQNPIHLCMLSELNFINTKQLSLKDCVISTAEPIQALIAPNLQKLSLKRNIITSVKPLRKLECKKLRNLDLSQNPIYQFVSLTQIIGDIILQLKLPIQVEYSHQKDMNIKAFKKLQHLFPPIVILAYILYYK